MRALSGKFAGGDVVRLMAFDVDGVLTDGTLWFGPAGDTYKAFHTLDGHGLKLLGAGGIEVAIVTGRFSEAVRIRADELGIKFLRQGVADKVRALAGLADEAGVSLQECGYMGDDVVDLPVMRACGFCACPADAHPLVRARASMVATRPGGRGAVREICEAILLAQGRLDAVLAPWLE